MKSAADHAEEASRLAELAAHTSSSRAAIHNDGSVIAGTEGDPTAYMHAAFEELAMAVSELAIAIKMLASEK